jgi:hypothetical protein
MHQKECEWLTKDELHMRAQLFVNALSYAFALEKRDIYAGACTEEMAKAILELFRNFFPKIVYHHDMLQRFLQIKVEDHIKTKKLDKIPKELYFQAGLDFANELQLHEIIHAKSGELGEEKVFEAVDKLMQDFKQMRLSGWAYIKCPNKKKNVTWNDCYLCSDTEKHPTCPFHALRLDAYPRSYTFGLYHVSELPNPRMYYYERIGEPYARSWKDYNPLLLGKALGWYIESKYAESCHEITLTYDGRDVRKDLPDDFKGVTGHQDLHIIDEKGQMVVELKLYAFIGYMIKANKPKPEHEFQVRAYYTMGKRTKPYYYDKVHTIKVTYYTKNNRESISQMDIDVPIKEVDVITPALLLHKALKEKNPDLLPQCPVYLCKRYCKHHDCKFNAKYKSSVMKKLGEKKNV